MGMSSYGGPMGSGQYFLTALDPNGGLKLGNATDTVITFTRPCMFLEVINRSTNGSILRVNPQKPTGGTNDILLYPDPNQKGNGEYMGIWGTFSSIHIQGADAEVRAWF